MIKAQFRHNTQCDRFHFAAKYIVDCFQSVKMKIFGQFCKLVLLKFKKKFRC